MARGFDVASLGPCCWVDVAIVEISEVRRRRVDGSGFGSEAAIGGVFSVYYSGRACDESR